MLKIVTTDGLVPLRFDKYWIQEETNGKDSFGLTIPLDDEQYPLIAEEVEAIDAETGLRYVFQQIDEGVQTATCKGSLCLDELKADVFIGYNSDTHRAAEIVASVVPKEWTVDDRSGVTIRRTVTLEGGTALDIIDAVCKTFSICVRYNNSARTITLIDPNGYTVQRLLYQENGMYAIYDADGGYRVFRAEDRLQYGAGVGHAAA